MLSTERSPDYLCQLGDAFLYFLVVLGRASDVSSCTTQLWNLMKRVLVSWDDKLVVAWVRALDVGHVVHARVRAKVGEGCAVVEGFLSQLRVAVRFATVQGTVFVEADGVGHMAFFSALTDTKEIKCR
jgi:hypothetical protein